MKKAKQKIKTKSSEVVVPLFPAVPWFSLPPVMLFVVLAVWIYAVLSAYASASQMPLFDSQVLSSIFSYYSSNQPIEYYRFLQHCGNLFLAGLIFFAAFGYGAVTSRLWSHADGTAPSPDTFWERILFSVGIGIGEIIFFTVAIGFSGYLYKGPVVGMLIAGAIAGIASAVPLISEWRQQEVKRSGWRWLALVIVLACIANLMGALVPETFYDSLVYNIGLSQNWINHHRIFSDRALVPSFYPLNIYIFYAVGVIVGNSIVAKLLAFGFLELYALGIYTFCRKHFTRETGLLAVVLLMTVPLLMTLGWKTVVEPGIAFFELLAMIACFNWFLQLETRWVILSGVFVGIALGSKYTFMLQIPSLLILFFGAFRLRSGVSARTMITTLGVFGSVTIAVAAGWFIKNYLQTGDPLYPVLLLARIQMHGSDPAPIALTMSNVFLFPWKYTMGVLQQETRVGPLFLIFLPLLLLYKARDKKLQVLLVYFVVIFLPWVTIGKGYQRFFLHGTGVVSIIIASYIVSLASPLIKKCVIALVCVLGFFNIINALYLQKTSMDPLGYLVGQETMSSYLSCMRMSYPDPYYPAYDWVNHNAPPDSTVLIVGETRGFYLERPYVASIAGFVHPFVSVVQGAATGEKLYSRLTSDGIHYMVLNASEARRLASYAMMPWQSKDIEVLFDFLTRHTEEVFHFCPEVTLNNGQRGSENTAFWQSYTRDPLNSVYVYRIVPVVTQSRVSRKQLPFLIYPTLYQEPTRSTIEKMIPSLEKR